MKIRINNLKPHPKHSEIYQTPKDIRSEWKDLFTSIEENGMMQPLIISQDNTIISGHRRWKVVNELGWDEVKVEKINVDEEKFNSMLVQLNTNREKTHAEKINEVLFLLKVIPKRQGQTLSEDEKGGRLTIIAKKLGKGFSRENISKIEKIKIADDEKRNPEVSLTNMLREGVSIHSVFNLVENKKEKENDIEKIISKEGRYTLINKDCSNALDEMKDASIQMCLSSPPFVGLRLYNGIGSLRNPNNIGEENSVEDYVKHIGLIAKKIFRVLKPSGSFFLNIGDTYKNGVNLAVPELLSVEMMKIGFLMANRIVWNKKNPKPMKTKTGFQPSYELLLHFVKQNDYKCRQLVWKSTDKPKITRGVGDRKINGQKEKKTKMLETPYRQFKTFFDENAGYTNIITSAVATAKKLSDIDKDLDHPALYPETLPFLPLLQTTDVGDKVLDIFGGSSTLGVVSNLFGREYIGVELNKEYHRVASIRMKHIQGGINPEIYEEFERMAA